MANTIHFNDAVKQCYPFYPPMVNYILSKIDGKHLYKLYQTCKFFPNQFPLRCVTKMVNDDKLATDIYVGSARQQSTPERFDGRKLWIMEEVIFQESLPFVHDWVKKISLCTIQKLIVRQTLLFCDYKILAQAGTIKRMSITSVCDNRLQRTPIEELLALVPNAEIVEVYNAHATPETSANMLKLQFNQKIDKIHLHILNQLLDPQLLFEFVKKHSTPESDYLFDFDDHAVKDIDSFSESVNLKMSKWNPPLGKPTLHTGSFAMPPLRHGDFIL